MTRPSPATLRRLLRYDERTGKLFWKPRTPEMFRKAGRPKEAVCQHFNTQFAGKEAFTADSHGYRTGALFDKLYRAHHVIWAMAHDEWPDDQIDHINHDRSDNRLLNLRLVSHAHNNRNLPLRRTNTSGVTGVKLYKLAAGGVRWRAFITCDGKSKYLGSFETKEEAVAARKAAERSLGFHPNHGRNP